MKESIAERTCEDCGYCFKSKWSRDHHVATVRCRNNDGRGKSHTLRDLRTQRVHTPRVRTGPDTFQCRYCPNSFNMDSVATHEDRIHFNGVKDPERDKYFEGHRFFEGRKKRARTVSESFSNNHPKHHEETVDIQGVTVPMRYTYLPGSDRRIYICDWPDCGAQLNQCQT